MPYVDATHLVARVLDANAGCRSPHAPPTPPIDADDAHPALHLLREARLAAESRDLSIIHLARQHGIPIQEIADVLGGLNLWPIRSE